MYLLMIKDDTPPSPSRGEPDTPLAKRVRYCEILPQRMLLQVRVLIGFVLREGEGIELVLYCSS